MPEDVILDFLREFRDEQRRTNQEFRQEIKAIREELPHFAKHDDVKNLEEDMTKFKTGLGIFTFLGGIVITIFKAP